MRISLPLIVRLSLGHWRLFGSVGLGVLLATTIMASGAIYFDSLEDLGLRRELAGQPGESLDLEIHANNSTVSRARHNSTVANVLLAVERTAGWFTDETRWAVVGSSFRFPSTAEQIHTGESRGVDPVGSIATFALFPDITERVNLLEGRLPAEASLPGEGESPVIEVMVSEADADAFDLAVDTPYALSPTWSTDAPDPTPVVTGIYERTDPTDAFWRMLDDVLGLGEGSRVQRAVLVTPGVSYLDVLGPSFTKMSSSYGFLVPR